MLRQRSQPRILAAASRSYFANFFSTYRARRAFRGDFVTSLYFARRPPRFSASPSLSRRGEFRDA